MSFWSWLTGSPNHSGETANTNTGSSVGPDDWNPGDPDGVDTTALQEPSGETRSLPGVLPSPWSGWPAEWNVPNWDFGSKFNELVDIAWGCLDLNARVMAAMPVYAIRKSEIVQSPAWMENPDPMVYASWSEFAHQLFWDWWCGEAFVMEIGRSAAGFPSSFRVVPPWLMHVDINASGRSYRLGGPAGKDVTESVLHIRYKSTTDKPRGVGPLEAAGGRMLTAGLLAKYARTVVESGGIIDKTLETDQELTVEEAQDMLNEWVRTRQMNLGYPPVLDNSVKLKTHKGVTPQEMAMIEIAQFTEGRIADLLGVPRALMGLPTGDTFTYSNVSAWFDHHDRTTLRPAAARVMPALSYWALPRGWSAELNRDEYSRPAFNERAEAWVKLKEAGIVSEEEIRTAERLIGKSPTAALTGGEQ